MAGTFVLEFSVFKPSKTAYLLRHMRDLSIQHTSIIFSFTIPLPFPLPQRDPALQALNHVTILLAKGNQTALPWVPINTCYLISQRGCWRLMSYSPIHSSLLPPQRLYHHCSHLSLGNESNRDWATQ
jgi:hypothetical protein